jgi:hypothetical protein
MTPVHPTPSREATRIPPQRFLTHVLFSASATATPQVLHYLLSRYFPGYDPKDSIVTLNWSLTAGCGIAIYAHVHPIPSNGPFRHKLARAIYAGLASHLVAAQYPLTLLLGRHMRDPTSGFPPRQHIAVHFCMAFCAISELEFYRAYMHFKKFETYTACFRNLLRANFDLEFDYTRDLHYYILTMPERWRRWLDGDTEPPCITNFWSMKYIRSHVVLVASWFVFGLVGGLANYPIECFVDPASGHGLQSARTNVFVLLGASSKSPLWQGFLGLALLRVVRQANYVGFWTVVGVLGRRGAMVGGGSEDGLECGYEKCLKCGGQHS